MLLLRKKRPEFNSIENVVGALQPFLEWEVVELPYPSKGFVPRFKNWLFVRRQKAAFVHITGYDHYLLAFGLIKNAILTIHDIEMLNRSSGLKRFLLKKFWFDLPIKNAKLVTTISEFSRREILGLGDYKTPIIVVPNPLTLEFDFLESQFNRECPRILQVGTKKNKNIGMLAEALENYSCKLIVIGKLSLDDEQKLKKHKIDFEAKEGLTNKQMVEEYQKCDLLAFLSTYEGFGLPVIEAQAQGRVVLASDVSSIPEVAGDGALLVNPNSVEAIRQGLDSILEGQELREKLIAKGLSNVNRFKPEVIARQYEKLYRKLV